MDEANHPYGNAELEVTIHRSGSSPVQFRTSDFTDINDARRKYGDLIAKGNNSSLVIADSDDAGFNMIAVRTITGIKVREVDPEREAARAKARKGYGTSRG